MKIRSVGYCYFDKSKGEATILNNFVVERRRKREGDAPAELLVAAAQRSQAMGKLVSGAKVKSAVASHSPLYFSLVNSQAGPRVFLIVLAIIAFLIPLHAYGQTSDTRPYNNKLTRIENPKPILADHPEFFEPIIEQAHYEAAPIVDDPSADLHVRAWRFSYNARGIVEMPNHLLASETAVIMVHPWGIDDPQGWVTPQPAGVADFCTPEKNHLAAKHTHDIVRPFINEMRPRVGLVLYSLPGKRDAIRHKMYRSFDYTPNDAERKQGAEELEKMLKSFDYRGQPLPESLSLSKDFPVRDYFAQFPGLDSSAKFNNAGFWDLPIPVTSDVDYRPNDVVIYDAEGYAPLKAFLQKNKIRHVLLTGYATDMCFCRTTAGYENLSKDFNVFLVGDASLATFPSNTSPRFAVNAAISFAALKQLITQVSWVRW